MVLVLSHLRKGKAPTNDDSISLMYFWATYTNDTYNGFFVLSFFYCLYRFSLHLSYLRPLFALLPLRSGQRSIAVYLVCMYLTWKRGLYIAV